MIALRNLVVAALIVGIVFACGCATPVGVNRMNPRSVTRELTANVLSAGRPSAFSRQFLERLSLVDLYEKDPQSSLATLHNGLGGPDEHARLFALSELSLAYAERSGKRAYYLASSAYAYAFLFPEAGEVNPYDPRVRIAMDLYNRGIAAGLRARKSDELRLNERNIVLPFGRLDLTVNPSGFYYGGYHLKNFVPVADFEVRGLRNRYRKPGIGVALSAKVEGGDDKGIRQWIPPKAKVPVTAFVRFAHPMQALKEGALSGKIELYDADEMPTVTIGRYRVPLETDPSAALAYRLEGAPVWDFGIAGFRRGDLALFGAEPEGDLFFLNPYRPGRIPVVFVHGTASSPARWAEMVNELLGDPIIATRYQFWFYMYNTGNPIALSSMHLRENLRTALKDIDPAGKDAALQEMVIIGHSQGGLLTKMMVVNSGSHFWNNVSKEPLKDTKFSAETKDLLRRTLFFEPLPFVKRVIFIATPHRGSFLAMGWIGRFSRGFITLPARLTKVSVELVKLNPTGAKETALHMPTAVDNMDWSNPFLKTLISLPIARGVRVNSIIPVEGGGPVEEGDDGVVRYASAHLDGVESELVVRSGHSTQAFPPTIEEVRRILYEHAGVGGEEVK